MKKLLFIFALMFGAIFVSCGNSGSSTNQSDSTKVDTAVVDSVVADTVPGDSIALDTLNA